MKFVEAERVRPDRARERLVARHQRREDHEHERRDEHEPDADQDGVARDPIEQALAASPPAGGDGAHLLPSTCTQRSELLISTSVQSIVAPNSTHARAEA